MGPWPERPSASPSCPTTTTCRTPDGPIQIKIEPGDFIAYYEPWTGSSTTRRQPRQLDTCCMVEVDPERFEDMVAEALDSIPGELGELMNNVAVTVQHERGPIGLLGLYQGVPLTRRTRFYAGALPDRITVYRRAICAICNSEAEVVEQVRRTVIHEVGHHFGISDARLRELGW